IKYTTPSVDAMNKIHNNDRKSYMKYPADIIIGGHNVIKNRFGFTDPPVISNEKYALIRDTNVISRDATILALANEASREKASKQPVGGGGQSAGDQQQQTPEQKAAYEEMKGKGEVELVGFLKEKGFKTLDKLSGLDGLGLSGISQKEMKGKDELNFTFAESKNFTGNWKKVSGFEMKKE
ncbi:hypothetical protein AKO1_006014, partial [Acrasis kona]